MFARFEKKTLVAEVLQGDDFAFDFFLRELLALDVLVLRVIRAVRAGVDAVVREVERRKEHDARAVDVFLHAHGRVENLLVDVFQVAGEQHGRFTVRETAEGGGLFEKRVDQGAVVLVFFGVGEGVENFFVTDELFSHAGFRIVHGRCLRAGYHLCEQIGEGIIFLLMCVQIGSKEKCFAGGRKTRIRKCYSRIVFFAREIFDINLKLREKGNLSVVFFPQSLSEQSVGRRRQRPA